MEMRVFGSTGMRLSVLGFGCGAVGGLMVRGNPLDQERTIARALKGRGSPRVERIHGDTLRCIVQTNSCVCQFATAPVLSH